MQAPNVAMDARVAWERYAQGRTPRRQVNARGARTWLNWTQYPDHGPDDSLLGDVAGRTVLELGCGTGCNLAHLATLGATCTGVDIAPTQRDKAQARWDHLPGLTFVTADALDFLTRHHHVEAYDIVLSIFGAVWFSDPGHLLPLVRQNLAPGGVFAFSHLPPEDDNATGLPTPSTSRAAIARRWDCSGEHWRAMLASAGFVNASAEVIPPPAGEGTGTLLVRAHAPAA